MVLAALPRLLATVMISISLKLPESLIVELHADVNTNRCPGVSDVPDSLILLARL